MNANSMGAQVCSCRRFGPTSPSDSPKSVQHDIDPDLARAIVSAWGSPEWESFSKPASPVSCQHREPGGSPLNEVLRIDRALIVDHLSRASTPVPSPGYNRPLAERRSPIRPRSLSPLRSANIPGALDSPQGIGHFNKARDPVLELVEEKFNEVRF